MAWADMFMSYMYCFVVRNIPPHIDYWWKDLSSLRLSDKLRGRRSYDVFSVFKIHACQRDEGIVILAGFFADFTGRCPSTTSSVSGGGSYVGMTTFSFLPLSMNVLRQNCILWLHVYSLYPKHYSYQHPSYLGVLDMCLIVSLYLHVLSLSVGFRYHYLWYCLYVYLLIICMYYFICGFYVTLSFDIVYMYICVFIYCVFIYWKSGTSDLLVLMLFILECTNYR